MRLQQAKKKEKGDKNRASERVEKVKIEYYYIASLHALSFRQ